MSTIDIPVNQPSSNRDIFNKLETVWTPGDIFDERDYVGGASSEMDNAGWENFELGYAGWKIKTVSNLYWEKIEGNDLVSLMEHNILQLWVIRDQVKKYFKEKSQKKQGKIETYQTDYPIKGNVDLRTESGMSDATLRKYMALAEPEIEFTYVGKSPSLLRSQVDRVIATKRKVEAAKKKYHRIKNKF